MDHKELLKRAEKAKENAYAPYSNFRVGAAIVTDKGNIYTGCNIENASYGATNCAERTAIFKAVSEGDNTINTIAIASDREDAIFPCGICRQVLVEFADKTTEVICGKLDGSFELYTLEQLLPKAYKKE